MDRGGRGRGWVGPPTQKLTKLHCGNKMSQEKYLRQRPLWYVVLELSLSLLGSLSSALTQLLGNVLQIILGNLMNPTVVLILGGFTIAAALNKYHLDKRLVRSICAVGRVTFEEQPEKASKRRLYGAFDRKTSEFPFDLCIDSTEVLFGGVWSSEDVSFMGRSVGCGLGV